MRNPGESTPHDVAVVLGTRPEAVKLLSVVRALAGRARLVHTGQHYDDHLWFAVAGDLGLPAPAHAIRIGGLSRGEQIGEGTTLLTRYLMDEPASAIVVQGDTNSTLAGALAGTATRTPVVHVEAGLRSDDPSMPEEGNRLITDRIADVCCAPTEANAARLRAEGVPASRIVVTGNTLAETMKHLVPSPGARRRLLTTMTLSPGGYVLATVHRASNVDDVCRLRALLEALDRLAQRVPVLLPLHPRTRTSAEQHGLLRGLAHIRLVPPLPPATFLALEAEAGLLVSDSGGVQEEAALLRVPLLVLRDSTERPELLGTWARLLGDADPCLAVHEAWDAAPAWRARLRDAPAAYAFAEAGTAVVTALDSLLAGR